MLECIGVYIPIAITRANCFLLCQNVRLKALALMGLPRLYVLNAHIIYNTHCIVAFYSSQFSSLNMPLQMFTKAQFIDTIAFHHYIFTSHTSVQYLSSYEIVLSFRI